MLAPRHGGTERGGGVETDGAPVPVTSEAPRAAVTEAAPALSVLSWLN